ncbi:hypothetical protein DFR86_01975 [Acidianus sulfidivorans JP7]|uniref:Uncharacterized protein n=1 Tax=Acidianus sulfidivorans JP7 TaxID=619593 RepID=A0A2U9IKC3_9CREN|nr:hypothetical protein [Acidianus sulfidivorans]AWR96435.1 hypothetical protein DFR86_01975 [Acidianus sulfidivorans JP7]
MEAIKAGYNKLKEVAKSNDVYLFKGEDDEYYLVAIKEASCSEKSKIIDKVLDEIYKYGNEFFVTIIITSKENFEKIKDTLGERIL